MAIYSGVGVSKDPDSKKAGYEACKVAMQNSGQEKPSFLFVFASPSLNQAEMLKGVNEASGNVPLIGCSTAGEITNNGPSQKSAVVMAITTDQITFTTGLGENIKADVRQAGRAVAQSIKEAQPSLQTFLMLPDVLAGNGAEIVRGVLDVLGAHFPVVGGAAGDDFLFQKTYQYKNNEVFSGAVAGVGLSGKFTMAAGVRHGWIPIGIPMKVTKSEGAVVYELDHRPAVSIYEDYFGKQAEELKKEPLARMAITYPLGIKLPDMDEYLIRDPITVDDKGAITCAAEIPEDSEIRLMIGSKEKAIEAAQDAAKKIMAEFVQVKSKPKFVLMFNCIAREKLFGAHANDEIQAVLEIIGRDVPLIGFYTYGEQAPMGGEMRVTEKINSRFFNETMVMLAIGE